MSLDFVKMCGKHAAIYEAYYKQIDPQGKGAIESLTAAKFLKKSGLSDVVLSRIWDMSDPQGRGCLDKPGFFVALKLVSLAQAGEMCNMKNIYNDTVNPPKVGDIPKPTPTPVVSRVQPPVGGVANGDWSIGVIDRLKYEQLFESLRPVNGMLGGNKVKGVLMDSKLPFDTLGLIWDLADQDKDGNLDKHEFIVAMHLVSQTLQKRTVPKVLPPELRKHAGPPKPAPPIGMVPRPPSGEGFVANFPKDIPPPAALPPMPIAGPASMTRIPPVGAASSQPLMHTDPPLVPIGAPHSVTANADWVVTPADMKRYEILFRESDRDKDGLVSGLEVKNVFLQSGVPQKCLAHIWALSDTNQSGKLTLDQFALAMWMVERKQRGIEPPEVLTANMVPPSVRGIVSGIDLQPQEVKPTYTNPELEMISKEIEELARERRALETEIAQKEADVRIKNGEVRSLQNEYDTLSATLKQLEHQRGEAQKRLDDLKAQSYEFKKTVAVVVSEISRTTQEVAKIREQCQKQEDTINEQEGELNSKKSELQKLKDEETALQNEYDEGSRELARLTQHLQNTQLQISSVRSMVTQLQETQRQMTDALLICRAAIDSQNTDIVSEYQLKMEPDFDEARKLLAKEIEMPKAEAFGEPKASPAAADAPNGFSSDTFATAKSQIGGGFDDSFNASSGGFSSGFDAFGSSATFGQQQQKDPFGGDAFGSSRANAVTPEPGKDDFGSDPFAALHAPTGQGQVLNPNRPESPSPALPPKKSKVPPPRPAPPRPMQGPTRPAPPNTESASGAGASANTGGFADFADFDNKLKDFVSSTRASLPKSSTTTATESLTSSAVIPSSHSLFDVDFGIFEKLEATKSTATATATPAPISKLPLPLSSQQQSSSSSVSSLFSSPNAMMSSLSSQSLANLHTKALSLNTNHLTRSQTPPMQAAHTFDRLVTNKFSDSNGNSQSQNNISKSTTTSNTGEDFGSDPFAPLAAAKSTSCTISGPLDFQDDPFKDYRYADPFSIKDPFDDDEVLPADTGKAFKDTDFSSDDEDFNNKFDKLNENNKAVSSANNAGGFGYKQAISLSSELLQQFGAFSASPVPSQSSSSSAAQAKKSPRNTPVLLNAAPIAEAKAPSDKAFEAFADFDAFATKQTHSNDLFDQINGNKNSESKPVVADFAAFDAFSAPATKTKNQSKIINKNYDAFSSINSNANANSDFSDDFFKATATTTRMNYTKLESDFAKFDPFDDVDFSTLNNNNLQTKISTGNASNSAAAAAAPARSSIPKLQNRTTLMKTSNIQKQAEINKKFVADYSKPETFNDDLEEAIQRSLYDN